MDPKETKRLIEKALDAEEWDLAHEYAGYLLEWLLKEGFHPGPISIPERGWSKEEYLLERLKLINFYHR